MLHFEAGLAPMQGLRRPTRIPAGSRSKRSCPPPHQGRMRHLWKTEAQRLTSHCHMPIARASN